MTKTHKIFYSIAFIFGALAVVIGAFGAHAMKASLIASGRFDAFETAVRYQFYHTFAILLFLQIKHTFHFSLLKWSVICFIIGVVLFSGSLYLICFFNNSKIGILTPFGGLFFVLGWILGLIAVLKKS